jgi:Domain of unknown function (DUF4136)
MFLRNRRCIFSCTGKPFLLRSLSIGKVVVKPIRINSKNHRYSFLFPLAGLLVFLLYALPVVSKVAIDFDPNLDFAKYRTFAYIGGQEQLLRMQLNPEQLNNQIHRSIARELTSKGLREVQPEENPDLVVRYSIDTSNEVGVGYGASWGIWGSYWTGHWSVQYISMHTHSAKEGTLGIELIDAKARSLAWRMFATEKILHSEPAKIWKVTDNSIKKGFKSYQPSAKDIAAKKEQWAKEDAEKKSS